jgi:hypothetical protein
MIPADDEPKRNRQNDCETKAPGNAEEGSDDILEEKPMLQQIGKTANNLPWAGQQLARVPHNGYLPDGKQNGNEGDWTKPDEQIQSSVSFAVSAKQAGLRHLRS